MSLLSFFEDHPSGVPYVQGQNPPVDPTCNQWTWGSGAGGQVWMCTDPPEGYGKLKTVAMIGGAALAVYFLFLRKR